MQFKLYQKEDKMTCLNLLKSNQPLYFNHHDLYDFEEWLETGQMETYWVLMQDHKAIGCGGIFINHELQEAGLAWGMIHHEYHQYGYGRRLVEFRLNEISKRVSYPIKLCTSQHTYRFYEKLGFRIHKITLQGFDETLDRYDLILEL